MRDRLPTRVGARSRNPSSLVAAILAMLIWVAPAPASETERPVVDARTQITELLHSQAAAWSRGDLDAFVSIYAEDAHFLSTSGLTQGRRQVLERYQKRYPDRAAMGTLTLDVLDFQSFVDARSTVGASVVARWTLSYPDSAERETVSGLTLLTFRARPEGGFEIIHDASM